MVMMFLESLENLMLENPEFQEAVKYLGVGVIVSIILAFLFLALLFIVAFYVYTSLSLYTVGKKLGYEHSWIAWIPIVHIAMILQLGGFHWAWVFLILIPLLGWIPLIVLIVISTWRIFERRNYPGWLALIPLFISVPGVGGLAIIAFLIVLGFVAWKDKPDFKSVTNRARKIKRNRR